MKTWNTLIICLVISYSSFAQPKRLSLELGFQGYFPENVVHKDISKFDEQRAGIGLHVMPKYNFSENYTLGLNIAYLAIAEDAQTDNIGSFTILSVVPTFQHKLLKCKFSPFYSAGFGSYSVLNSSTPIAPGFALNAGIEIFNFTLLSLEYNRMLTKIAVNENVITGFDKWYYFGFKLGFDIGIKK
jgi:hypothetical protein